MARITVIKASEAPAPPAKRSTSAEKLLAALSDLKRGEVLKVTPDAGRSLRGLKTGVGRITTSASVKVTTWDDGTSLYLKRS